MVLTVPRGCDRIRYVRSRAGWWVSNSPLGRMWTMGNPAAKNWGASTVIRWQWVGSGSAQSKTDGAPRIKPIASVTPAASRPGSSMGGSSPSRIGRPPR